jgi:RNA polymerase sigma-70 factor, ECF subfamily
VTKLPLETENTSAAAPAPGDREAIGLGVSLVNLSERSDLKLVDQLVSGCDLAWGEFVSGYAGLVRSRVAKIAAACGLGADNALLDDLVAEVFSALLQNDCSALRAFSGRSSLATYLAVIATRVAIRKSVRLAPPPSPGANYEPEDQQATPVQAALSAEQHEYVRQLILELPDKQRSMVQLFYLEGFSYEQISARLGVPMGSVGPTLKRAEAKLKSRLECDESSAGDACP